MRKVERVELIALQPYIEIQVIRQHGTSVLARNGDNRRINKAEILVCRVFRSPSARYLHFSQERNCLLQNLSSLWPFRSRKIRQIADLSQNVRHCVKRVELPKHSNQKRKSSIV